jgi:hypothetical protein
MPDPIDERISKKRLLSRWWLRLLFLVLIVSALSVFVITRPLAKALTVRLQYSPVLGPLFMVADVVPENQIAGKQAFALLSILILLPVVRFRLGTVIAAMCGLVAWVFVGIAAAGIQG